MRFISNALRRALTVKDLEAAHASKTPIVIQACEGAHWIEGQLERIEEVYKRGLRHLQLLHQMHDLVAPLGGVQQLIEPPGGAQSGSPCKHHGAHCFRSGRHQGMQPSWYRRGYGAWRRRNRHGRAESGAAALGGFTHTALDPEVGRSADLYVGNPGLKARLASKNYAKAVADAGGIVGIWRIFPTMKDYVTGIKQMVDVVGIDHVGIGTDTSIAPGAVGGPVPGTNNSWPDEMNGFLYSVAQEMLTQGFEPNEISRMAGGNYVRLFERVTRSAA